MTEVAYPLCVSLTYLVEVRAQQEVGSPQEEAVGAVEREMPLLAILAISAEAGVPPGIWVYGHHVRQFCDLLWPGYSHSLPWCDRRPLPACS